MKKSVGRPRKGRIKFSTTIHPEDADFLKEKELAGMRKNVVIDQAFDALREKIDPFSVRNVKIIRAMGDNAWHNRGNNKKG